MEIYHRHRHCATDGFTLVEMSVVLLIIALIVGGIVVGSDMITNSQMQTIIADVERFKNASKQFRDKYNYLPGDLPTAATFWGTDAGCPVADSAPKTETCNGDGDGKIRETSSTFTSPASLGTNAESLRVWQHLANAGFIEGLYNGAAVNSNYKPGVNIPKSELNEAAGFIFFYSDPVNSSNSGPGGAVPAAHPSNYGHIIEFGGGVTSTAVTATFSGSYALTTAQALIVDKKADDGMPSSGNILSFTNAASPNCNDGSTPPQYATSNTGTLCSLIFLTGL